MTVEHYIFRFINPIDNTALNQCLDAVDSCSFPWDRCLPELTEESEGKVSVFWGDAGQGVTGSYHGSREGVQNAILLNTRYSIPNYAFTFLHECGHMVDDTYMNNAQRTELINKWHTDLEGPWDDNPNTTEWSHEYPHTHRTGYPDGGWEVNDAHYFHKPTEAFADTFVACFAPSVFSYPRFAHWSTDYANLREMILNGPAPVVVPTRSAFPNDKIYRLYRAVFLREPDRQGYNHWLWRLNAGEALYKIAGYFTSSKEFQLRYGSVSNREFVTLLYQNVLNRAPDSGGLSNWVNQLNSGKSRGEVLLGFSESTEFRNKINRERLI